MVAPMLPAASPRPPSEHHVDRVGERKRLAGGVAVFVDVLERAMQGPADLKLDQGMLSVAPIAMRRAT